MKKTHLFITTAILLFSISMTAQSNNYGRVKMDSERTTETDTKERQKDLEKEKTKSIDKTVATLKKEMDLDALQEIAIKQIIVENTRIEGIIIKKEDSDEQKGKALDALNETTDTRIAGLLNPAQKEKYIKFKANYNKKNR